MDSDAPHLGKTSMFFVGGAVGTALAAIIGFMTMMALDETVAQEGPVTAITASTQGGVVTQVDTAETTLTFIGTEFAYSPMDGSVSGDFELVFENAGRVIHNLEIEGAPGFVLEADPGRSASATIRVEPGTYTIFCSIPGHEAAGMVGTLTVEE